MYIASSVDAVALIVIDVDTLSSGMPSSSTCMSSTVSIATPTRPDFAQRARRVGVDAHLGRQVERDAQSGLSGGEQMSEPAVRFRGRTESGVLAHRPEPSAVHRRLHAARERIPAGIGEVARVVERRVRRPMDGLDGEARRRIHGIRHSVEASLISTIHAVA